MSKPSTRRIPKLISGFSLLVCLLLVILKLYVSITFIPDISGSEGSTILPIQRIMAGAPVYTNPQEVPFLISQYTPLYFLLTAGVAKLFSINPEEVHKVFIISRFLSILITIIGAGIIGIFLNFRVKTGKWLAILAACFVYQILCQWFLTSSRPDSLLFLITTLFIGVTHRAISDTKSENLWWVVAIFLGVTAFFTKQNGAVHCISVGIFLIVQKQWKHFFKLSGFGIIFFLGYLAILPNSSLNTFFLNIVGGVSNSASWGWFYDWTLQKLLFQFAPLIALNIVCITYCIRDKEDRFLQFLSIASIAFFTFSTIVAFKIGSGVGYYQGYLVVSVIQIATFISKKFNANTPQTSFQILLSSLYLGIVAVHCILFVYMRYTAIPFASFKSQYIEQNNVAQFIKSDLHLKDDEHVYITESEGMDGNYLKHFLFKNTIAPFPDIVDLGNRNRTFDYKKFDDLINENKIKYVITRVNQKPKTILGHGFCKAKKIKTINSYDIYENY